MYRILAPILLAVTLPACAITPPSSMFTSIGKGEEEPRREVRREVQRGPQEKKEAGVGASVSSLWDSVKSGLSFSDDKQEPAAPAVSNNEKIQPLDPAQALQLVNAYRTQKGLSPLQLNPQLNQAALAHAQDLSKSDRISHYGSDGSDTWERVRRTGYKARVTAENVGTGQRTLGEVFRGWQNSPDHNKNLLLSDAEEMGIAMVHNPDTQFKTFWTMVFGSPNVATAQTTR